MSEETRDTDSARGRALQVAKEAVREVGLCGEPVGPNEICILTVGHEDHFPSTAHKRVPDIGDVDEPE